ncbi:MAG TPA: heavy-metal-associated domain-containing protein [Rhodocyclaceae bacterium]|nr:heavy-metal-associated domain-containing protein [Rhodocyclaceae bacterium]
MHSVTLKLEGMHCDGCAATIQALIERTGGVQRATVSFRAGEARVLYDRRTLTEAQLTAAIEKGGFRVIGRSDD